LNPVDTFVRPIYAGNASPPHASDAIKNYHGALNRLYVAAAGGHGVI
jgi:hypothetical protein